MVEINYRKTIITTSYWINWLEPLKYVKEKKTKELLDKIHFKKINSCLNKKDSLKRLEYELNQKQELIKNKFLTTSDGILYAGLNTIIVDNLIKQLFIVTKETASEKSNSRIALIALGGYGRGELAPHSDIDILFLMPENQNKLIKEKLEKKIESILYFLWDLGFTIGHSTRTVKEAIKDCRTDQMFLTSLLENRFLVGSNSLYSSFKLEFDAFLNKSNILNFVKNKLEESEKRHIRFGSSRYVVEPNVKEGKGGIRDLHTLIWIAKYAYKSKNIKDLLKNGALSKSELYAFADAHRFLLSVRCHLHIKAGREDDNLATDSQIEISEMMKFRKILSQSAVERFMKRYFLATKMVGNLTRIFCFAIEEDFKKPLRFNFFKKTVKSIPQPFTIENKRLGISKKEAFYDDPLNLIMIFHLSHYSNLEIHPKTIRYIADCTKLITKSLINNKQTNTIFYEILTSRDDPSKTLRLMNEANVLGRFVPEFQKVVGLIQYDMYHYYTVDEHTIFTIANVHSLKEGLFKDVSSFASEAISNIKSFKALMVALFLHDIAKGQHGDHSKNGAEMAKKICPRLGLGDDDTELVSWLVLNHLLLSKVAFSYDLTDKNIVDNCTEIIQSKEKLDLLLILTVCDIKAVGPKVWNDWKGALIHELYVKVRESILKQPSQNHFFKEVDAIKEKIFQYLKNKGWDVKKIKKYFSHLNNNYWNINQIETIKKHALIFNEMLENERKFEVKIFNQEKFDLIELIVIAPDHHGLFSKISGIVSSCGFDIVTAKIFTRTDGFALDTLLIQNKENKIIFEKRIQENLIKNLKQGLEGRYNYKKELENRWQEIPSRFREMKAPVRVLVDNKTSKNFTVVEINCKNSPGVLHIITKSFSELGLQVNTASISTFGNRVKDNFYVNDLFGQKISDKNKISEIKLLILKNLKEIDPANEMV